MKKYIALAVALTLAIAWVISFGVAGYPTVLRLYVRVAPWWHLGLFIVWFVAQLWANALFVIWIYERPLRQQRKDLAHQPPQHAG